MKKILGALATVTIALFSTLAIAEKIIIKGSPTIIEKKGEVYFVPDTYSPTTDYYYITTDGVNRVCYKDKQPNINLEVFPLDVEVGGKRITWTCYAYDETLFEVQP